MANKTTSSGVVTGGKAGEKMKFGPYNWLVLERKGNTALIITEGIIERVPYHTAAQGITWEGCALRGYLNGKFLDKFSPADRAKIIEVTNQLDGGFARPAKPIFWPRKSLREAASASPAAKSGPAELIKTIKVKWAASVPPYGSIWGK